ncbi:MAG TPA: hypothetical protein VGR16_12485 [Thermomicrobiales bacterium]|nr:hypothetical protein [Thermomicrobiales bacterium]
MDNSPKLPYVSIVIALAAAAAAAISYFRRGGGEEAVFAFNELEIGLVALAVTLLIFAVEGLISVISEGRVLVPGRAPPRLTNPLSLAIVIASLVLFADAVLVGVGLVSDWDVWIMGWLAGVGCFLLATLLVFYKEAFVGDEARFDERDDGIPW